MRYFPCGDRELEAWLFELLNEGNPTAYHLARWCRPEDDRVRDHVFVGGAHLAWLRREMDPEDTDRLNAIKRAVAVR